jgi:hypothetical protein
MPVKLSFAATDVVNAPVLDFRVSDLAQGNNTTHD